MNTQKSIHSPHGTQAHQHDHGGDHSHDHAQAQGSGSRLMRFLGVMAHATPAGDWISNYRSARLLPVSDHALIVGIVVLAAGVIGWHLLPPTFSSIALVIAIAAAAHLALVVIGGLALVLFMRRIRTSIRNKVLNSIQWRGTEQVLDVGCGTGMMLNGCATKLTTGKAIGIDLWEQDVAGTRAVLVANARAEGVQDRIELREMDARDLSFPDATFDVVVSSAALHHIGTEQADREKAVSEMIRVLKPGGTISLVDVPLMIDIAESVIAQAGLRIVNSEKKTSFKFVTAIKPG